MCKKHLIFAGDVCLSLEISRDREMKDKSGPLPPKNPTAGTLKLMAPNIFSSSHFQFSGEPCLFSRLFFSQEFWRKSTQLKHRQEAVLEVRTANSLTKGPANVEK